MPKAVRSSITASRENPLVTALLIAICAADAVRVDDKLYGFKSKPIDDWLHLEQYEYTRRKIEDYETIFETELHLFNWWEIREESSKLNDNEWKIGNHIVSFFNIVPI